MKKALFVCIENSCRSEIAEAFARIHGTGIIGPYSSSSRPSGVINPKAIEPMKDVGYNMSTHNQNPSRKSQTLNMTMGCGDACPFVKAKHREDWGIPDPEDMDTEGFRQVRGMIEERARGLLQYIKETLH